MNIFSIVIISLIISVVVNDPQWGKCWCL